MYLCVFFILAIIFHDVSTAEVVPYPFEFVYNQRPLIIMDVIDFDIKS